MRYTGLLLALVATVSSAKDVATIDPLEFMVAWPDLVGKEVVITKGRISMASDMFMLLKLPGGMVGLEAPWTDRDDLRYLFQHCAEPTTNDQCDVAVQGTVKNNSVAKMPILTGVDFFKPAGN